MSAEGYQLHPTLLDGCFQLAMALIPESYKSKNYLPFSIQQLDYWQAINTAVTCYAQYQPGEAYKSNAQTFSISYQLVNSDGQTVAMLTGVAYKQVNTPIRQKNLHYELTWQKNPAETTTSPFSQRSGCWLILSDERDLAQALSQHLQQQGERCVHVTTAQEYHRYTAEHIQLNPSQKGHFKQLLQDSLTSQYPSYRGIIYIPSIGIESEPYTTALTQNSCLLHLLQTLIKTNDAQLPRLWIITQDSQPVPSYPVKNIAQATLWGFGRTLQIEQPEIHCTLIDIQECTAQTLFKEIWYPDRETQIAWRENIRYTARLTQPLGAFQVQTAQPGTLEALTCVPVPRQIPQADEVEVEIVATALNFRDVLNALGMLKDTVSDTIFGFECAGKITALGAHVTHLHLGDAVIVALVTGGLASHVCVKAERVILKPLHFSYSAASTIPLVFLTSHYALTHLAKLQPGEKVLIHAATGGVGLSAIQIAQRRGAEIFATASPSKWETLKALGITHIMNSRTLDFAEQIQQMTNGVGVDVVLNSLSEEFIPKSLSVLRPGGRFIEIGEVGKWDEHDLQGVSRAGIIYYSFDLKEILKRQPQIITTLLKEIETLFKQGELHPLPHQEFPIAEMEDAFRYLAQAKHIGKVVITQVERNPLHISPTNSYLISGGLGALGLLTVQWLATKGAKHLALIGRQAPNPQAQAIIAQLQAQGVIVSVYQSDIAQETELSDILQQINPPLRGIIHAAGQLDDAMLIHQTAEKFQTVMAAKIAGSWNLHHLTKDLPIDFFITYSSTAALLGSLGQCNYAAANAFQDALAHYRRATGLPALNINWGPWENIGMAQLNSRDKQRMTHQGVIGITVEEGLAELNALTTASNAQMAIFNLKWAEYLAQLITIPPFLENYQQNTQSKSTLDFHQQLKNTPADKQYLFVKQFVQTQVAKVLGIQNLELITLQRGFSELGMDSLTAVELRNHLQTSLTCTLPATLAFDYPTLETLVNYLIREVFQLTDQTESAEDTETLPSDIADILSTVENLSDFEIQKRFAGRHNT